MSSLPEWFVVTRTSSDGRKPCEGARWVPFVRRDRRILHDLPDCPPGLSFEAWESSGRNHHREGNVIWRDFDEQRWVVKISDLVALRVFVRKYGRVIVSLMNDAPLPYWALEIYDDYRE